MYVPFILVSFFGSFLVVSSPSPLMMWVGMEISSFFFVPILQSLNVGAWKYFLTQGLSSFFLFLGFVVGEGSSIDLIWIFLSLSIKLGLFPFFGWMIHLSSNVSWLSFFLLGSIQKLPPLIFLAKNSETLFSLFLPLVMVSMGVLVLLFLSNLSIRWMMMLSSVFNVGWLSLSALIGIESFGYYMIIYFMLNFLILSLLSLEDSKSFSSSFKISEGENTFFVLGFFFLMGLPPIGTFIGKIEILGYLIELGMVTPCLAMIFLSSVVTFFYLKVCLGKSLFSPTFFIFMMSKPKVVLWTMILLFPFFMFWIF